MSARPELPDELAPDFEYIRSLGQGAMGTVHLAREVALRRLVAIKVPHAELARDPHVRARFEREARAAARIVHPGAATVYRTGTLPDGTPFLVMEYVSGRTLDHVLAGGPLAPDRALEVLAQLSRALSAAHATGVVHRDVRPGNVIWNEASGRAVLTDFGIAGILETGSEAVTRITRAGQALGEVGFSSPEQLLGEPVTAAADVYSLGVVAFHLVAGEGPFPPGPVAASIRARLEGEPRRLDALAPQAPPGLAALAARCLDRVPARRPSASGVAEELDRLREGGGARGHLAPGAASALPLALQDFMREVRRRRVGRAGLTHFVIAAAVLTATELLLPGLPLDEDRAYAMIVALLLGTFPITLVVAWLYDFTASGIERTRHAAPVRARGLQLALQVGAVALSLAISASLAFWILG